MRKDRYRKVRRAKRTAAEVMGYVWVNRQTREETAGRVILEARRKAAGHPGRAGWRARRKAVPATSVDPAQGGE
jgi:hypothetical protein